MKAGEGHHRLAVRLLGATLDRRSCQKALLITKPKDLREVLHFMEDVKVRLAFGILFGKVCFCYFILQGSSNTLLTTTITT